MQQTDRILCRRMVKAEGFGQAWQESESGRKVNSDKSGGPKMTPMNPKRDKPITTPKTVISG